MQEVELCSERSSGWPCGRQVRLQSTATELYQEAIFEELKQLEEKESTEALVSEQKKAYFDKASK